MKLYSSDLIGGAWRSLTGSSVAFQDLSDPEEAGKNVHRTRTCLVATRSASSGGTIDRKV